MKRRKKIFAVLLTCVVLLSNSMSVMADDWDGDGIDDGPSYIEDNPAVIPQIPPNASYNGKTGTLDNMPAGALYSFDDMNYVTYIQGTVLNLGSNRVIYVVPQGGGVMTDNALQQIINITTAGSTSATGVTPTDYQNNNGKITGLSSDSQFSDDDGQSWEDVSNGTVTGLTPDDYAVRNAGGVNRLPSIPQIVTVPSYVSQKMPTPDANFEASTMTLGNLQSTYVYSVDGGSNYRSVNGSSMKIDGVSENYDIKLINKGEPGDNTDDSDVQTIDIQKQPTPNPQPVDVSSIGGTGGITNVHSGMEYRADSDGSSWKDTGEEVTGLRAGTYIVRAKASQHYLMSDEAKVTLREYTEKKEPTPNASYDGRTGRLSNMPEGSVFSLNQGSSWVGPVNGGTANVSNADWNGIYIKKPGNGKTTVDSDVQIIRLQQAEPPYNVRAVDAADSQQRGSIVHVNNTMQYRKSNQNEWNDIHGSVVEGLKTGTYQVRVRSYDTYLTSDYVEVTIHKYTSSKDKEKEKQSTPSVTFNAANLKLSNVKNGMQISLDGGNSWYKADHDGEIQLQESQISNDKGIRVYMPGGDNKRDSDTEVIEIKKFSVPTGLSVTDAINGQANGAIHGVNNSMQYKEQNASSWINITGSAVTGLKAGTYMVRAMGAYDHLPSQPLYAVIGNASTQLVKPAEQKTEPAVKTETTEPKPAEQKAEEPAKPAETENNTSSEPTEQAQSNSDEDMDKLLTEENESGIVIGGDTSESDSTQKDAEQAESSAKVNMGTTAKAEKKTNWGLVVGIFAGVTVVAAGAIYFFINKKKF